MGVPLFFRLLNKKYHIIRSSPDKTIKALYIDTNCLLHPQCFTVLDQNKDLADQKVLFEKMAHRIVEYINYLIRLVNPTDLVYIAIDGVAPLAKINQQRMRRFGYANNYRNDIYKKYGYKVNENWSNIVITPGTKFMHDLHLMLHEYYINHIKSNPSSTYKIIYDSYLTPGEGEHKILQHLKQTTSIDEPNATIIYGLDADLIFLAMASLRPNIYLLRESSHFNRDGDTDDTNIEQELCYADIDFAKESINKEFNEYYMKFMIDRHGTTTNNFDVFDDINVTTDIDSTDKLKTLHRFDFTNDYIFICYLLGNDFLPHLPSIDISMEGMTILFNAYIEVFQMLGRNLITLTECQILTKTTKTTKSKLKSTKSTKSKINTKIKTKIKMSIDNEFLIEFIRLVASREEDFFRSILPEGLRRHHNRRCLETEPHKREIWRIENLKDVVVQDVVRLGMGRADDWKFRYYSHYFKTAEHMSEMVDRVCHNYIEGLIWVARYYFESCPTWRWQYKFTHAPFLSDLLIYLESKNIMTDFNTKYQEPVNMYTQLVSVVPPSYSHILPLELQHLNSTIDSAIIDMFPIGYKIDMINKTQLYKCVPMIPYLNASRVDKCITDIKLSKPIQDRATHSDPFDLGTCKAGKAGKAGKTDKIK